MTADYYDDFDHDDYNSACERKKRLRHEQLMAARKKHDRSRLWREILALGTGGTLSFFVTQSHGAALGGGVFLAVYMLAWLEIMLKDIKIRLSYITDNMVTKDDRDDVGTISELEDW